MMFFLEENKWLIYILIKALKMKRGKKIHEPKIHAITRHVKICHRSYIQVEEQILCTV